MTIPIGELIDCALTAEWRRRKAEEHPNDSRNMEAALLLERLAPEIAALNGSEIHSRLEGRYDAEIVSTALRKVGFQLQPNTGLELLESIDSELAPWIVLRCRLDAPVHAGDGVR